MKEKIKLYALKHIRYVIGILIISSYFFLNAVIDDIPNYFSENSSFYFYSSILQANAAIFSIVGVFYIFRIQSLQASIDIIKSGLMNDQGRSSWPQEIIDWDNLSLKEKEGKINNGTANKHILKSLVTWTKKERAVDSFKQVIRFPSVLLAIGILLESLSLFSASYIHNQYQALEYYVAYTNLMFEFIIVIYVVKTILSFLK